jgi:hypothetical protein
MPRPGQRWSPPVPLYAKKVRDGETVLTRIHHRQTPLFLMQHLVEAGVTWRSEAIFQEQTGNPIGRVDDNAFKILEHYGFRRFVVKPEPTKSSHARGNLDMGGARYHGGAIVRKRVDLRRRNRCSGAHRKCTYSSVLQVMFAIWDSFVFRRRMDTLSLRRYNEIGICSPKRSDSRPR